MAEEDYRGTCIGGPLDKQMWRHNATILEVTNDPDKKHVARVHPDMDNKGVYEWDGTSHWKWKPNK